MNILRRVDAIHTSKLKRFIFLGVKNSEEFSHGTHNELSGKQEHNPNVLEELQKNQNNVNLTKTGDGRPQRSQKQLTRYRLSHPEFLPDPNPMYRHTLREKLERMDMMARRSQILIPEFYVGSVLAVEYSDPHSPSKTNRFVGICILREGCGLRASFTLRNVVDGQGVEVIYHMYDPTIKSIECLRLEKRLDDHLLYLRDAPPEYSTFPFDMEAARLHEGEEVPVNTIKVPLKPPPWFKKWEREDLKGVRDLLPLLSQNRRRKRNVGKKPWEKYDLMKEYRSSIPEEDQVSIFKGLAEKLDKMEEDIKNKRKIIK